MNANTADRGPRPNVFQRLRKNFSFRSSSVTVARPGDPYSVWSLLFKNWGLSGGGVTEQTAQGIPAFARAINVIADQIASLPLSVYRNNPDGIIVEAESHPLHRLLKFRPHPLYNSYDFRSTWARQLLLRGNCYVYPVLRNGEIQSLEFINEHPEIVKLDNGSYFYRFPGRSRPIRSDAILHFKLNSLDGICGQDTLQLFAKTFERAIAEIELGNKYFTNGGQVSGLLTPSTPLNDKQAKQALEVWKKTNTGTDKIGKVGMMPFGFDYTKLGDSMADAKLVESRRLTVEDISNITGVHPILLGNLDRATFTNVEELNRILVQFTLRSFGKVFEKEFNSKAFSSEELGTYFIRLNFDGLLRGDTEARAKFYQSLFNVRAISPNEIRRLEGMNAYEGGDRYDLPMASNTKIQNAKDGEAKAQ